MKALTGSAFSAYTSKEAHKIAHECPVSGGFHVNSELILVEILDAEGNPCAPGDNRPRDRHAFLEHGATDDPL